MSSKKKTYPKKTIKKKDSKRKPVSRKPLKKKTLKPAKPGIKKSKDKTIVVGTVTHYFPKVRAAVVKLRMPLAVGETVKIKGHTTDFTQNITSMQIDRVPVNQAKKRQVIGLQVDSRVRQHDVVYRASA